MTVCSDKQQRRHDESSRMGSESVTVLIITGIQYVIQRRPTQRSRVLSDVQESHGCGIQTIVCAIYVSLRQLWSHCHLHQCRSATIECQKQQVFARAGIDFSKLAFKLSVKRSFFASSMDALNFGIESRDSVVWRMDWIACPTKLGTENHRFNATAEHSVFGTLSYELIVAVLRRQRRRKWSKVIGLHPMGRRTPQNLD